MRRPFGPRLGAHHRAKPGSLAWRRGLRPQRGPRPGSQFVVELPAAAKPVATERSPESSPLLRLKPRRKRRVLIVDDNQDAAEALLLALTALGHEVHVAGDGPAALRLVPRLKPEVALLDIGLPVMDGYELARRLGGSSDELRLIAVTGYGQESDRRRSLEAGFFEHIVKPASLERIAALVDY